MKFRAIPLIAALSLAGGGAVAQATVDKQGSNKAPETASAKKAEDARAMKKLQESAQRLRESLQAMAQKKAGPDRDRAMEQAHQALFETQRAMTALPPDLRGSAAVPPGNYDQAVKKLMGAADSLRDSIIAISEQPAGESRDRAVERAQQALWETRLALVSAYDPGSASRVMGAGAQTSGNAAAGNTTAQKSAAGAATQQRSNAGATADAAAVLVLLPVQLASDEKLANGCWVRFYDGQNFRGSSLTLAGPVEMPQMHPAGNVWRDWESAVVGPKARVTTFDDENFRQRTASLTPGQRIADLRDQKLGWFDEVHSARVACTG